MAELDDGERYREKTSCYLIRMSSLRNNAQDWMIDHVIACLSGHPRHAQIRIDVESVRVGLWDVIHSLFRLGPDDIHSRNGVGVARNAVRHVSL